MTLKSHTKSEKKLTCGLENDMRNLANFRKNTWKCQNWYFHGNLLSKVEHAWAKNLQESEEESTCYFKIDIGVWRILIHELKIPKYLHFNGPPLNKIYNIWAEKCRGVMFDGTEYWCKIWRKTDLYFENWNEEFSKFLPEHVW